MVFFNDPVPIPDPAERAVKMAMAMREAACTLIASWRRRGRLLGFGAGIAQSYATLGQIGFAERSGYTAIGTVCNLASRLCAEAQDGQILIGQRVAIAVEQTITLEDRRAHAEGADPAGSGLQRAGRGYPTSSPCYRRRPTKCLSAINTSDVSRTKRTGRCEGKGHGREPRH